MELKNVSDCNNFEFEKTERLTVASICLVTKIHLKDILPENP